jgi:hypothetical protein
MVAALVPLASVVARRVGDVTGDFVAAEDRPAGEDDDDASPSETATNETNETTAGETTPPRVSTPTPIRPTAASLLASAAAVRSRS